MALDDENIKLVLEVNRALHDKDAARIIESVERFMKHHQLSVDGDLLMRTPHNTE